jgi:hypothetical protein
VKKELMGMRFSRKGRRETFVTPKEGPNCVSEMEYRRIVSIRVDGSSRILGFR